MSDWKVTRAALSEIQTVMAADGWTYGAAKVAGFIDLLDTGETERFASEITSGRVWGHMGSLFDSVLDDPALERRYDEARRKLADALQDAGVTSSHLELHATLLRGGVPPGWHRT